MKCLIPAKNKKFKYTHMVGTGGIGSGMLFKMKENHTLGRNESRLAELVPYKDYCKLHIIAHYVAIMLDADQRGDFEVFPIGKVGNDETGRRLYNEMKNAGMSMNHVIFLNNANTLFSICFQYPDSTGGNITASNSASSMVTPCDIDLFFKNFEKSGKGELILAAPEVPVDARVRLLEKGRERGSFNIASVVLPEISEFERMKGFEKTDLLSVNIDEARALAGIENINADSKTIVDLCIKRITSFNPRILITITDGANGCYGYSNNYLEYVPSLKTEAVGTGGAGDAFLAGVIIGLCCDLPFLKGKTDEKFSTSPLESAIELGTLLASLAVTSPDTIHQTADAKILLDYSKHKNVLFSHEFARLFRLNNE